MKVISRTALIQPLNQMIIRRDVMYPGKDWVCDKLNEDLSFKKQVRRVTEDHENCHEIRGVYEFLVNIGSVKPNGWVEVQEQSSIDSMWADAMQKLRQRGGSQNPFHHAKD